jgi:hypothetical protein
MAAITLNGGICKWGAASTATLRVPATPPSSAVTRSQIRIPTIYHGRAVLVAGLTARKVNHVINFDRTHIENATAVGSSINWTGRPE